MDASPAIANGPSPAESASLRPIFAPWKAPDPWSRDMSDISPFDAAAFNARFNHHDPDFGVHREAIFDEMRARCPVGRSNEWGGYHILTRYEDVVAVARDDVTFSSEDSVTLPGIPNSEMQLLPITIDPPRSFLYRNILMRFFRQRWLERFQLWADAFVDELIDEFIETGRGDVQTQLSHPLTANFIMYLTGLPQELWREYSEPVINGIGRNIDDEDGGRRRPDTAQMLSEEIERQRASPKYSPDEKVIPFLLNVEIDGRKLTHQEIKAVMDLLLAGGFDTTMALIGNSVLHLHHNPDKRRQLIDNPSLIDVAVEEYLRWVTPQQALFRTATQETEIGGVPVCKGDKVMLAWSAANHDPEIFTDPHEVRFDRGNNRHVAFGVGAHLCLGLNVARLEARTSLRQILARLPDFKVDEGGVVRPPGLGVVYGLEHLPITFVPGKKVGRS
jgi:cytochrome P450